MSVDSTIFSWARLNAALLECEDERMLRNWLEAQISAGRRTRALRVYGRLSAVRRARELTELDKRLLRKRSSKAA